MLILVCVYMYLNKKETLTSLNHREQWQLSLRKRWQKRSTVISSFSILLFFLCQVSLCRDNSGSFSLTPASLTFIFRIIASLVFTYLYLEELRRTILQPILELLFYTILTCDLAEFSMGNYGLFGLDCAKRLILFLKMWSTGAI